MKSNKLRFAELLKNASVFRLRPRCIGGIKYGEDSSFSKYKYLLPKVFDSRVIKVRLRDDTPRSHIRALKNYLYSVEMLNDDIF